MKPIRFLPLALIAFVGCSAPPPSTPLPAATPPQPGTPASFVEPAAVSAKSPREFRAMIDRQLAAIETNPRDYDAYLSIGQAYRKLGQLEYAARAFENASLVRPAEVEPRLDLAWIQIEMNRPDKAIPIYRELLARNPKDWSLKNSLAIAHRKKKEYGEALSLIREMLNVDKNNIHAINNLGLIYYETKAFELAELTLQKGKKINAGTGETYNNLGLVYLALSLPKNAIAEFRKAKELAPALIAPRMNLGSLYLDHSNFPLAAAEYREALSIDPLNLRAGVNLGVALSAMGETENAKKALTTVVEIDPNHLPALFNLGLLYQNQLQDFETALRLFRRFAALQQGKIPSDHEVFTYIRQLQAMPRRAPTPQATTGGSS